MYRSGLAVAAALLLNVVAVAALFLAEKRDEQVATRHIERISATR